jgi:hypothetical protein
MMNPRVFRLLSRLPKPDASLRSVPPIVAFPISEEKEAPLIVSIHG